MLNGADLHPHIPASDIDPEGVVDDPAHDRFVVDEVPDRRRRPA
jgi:hypothetical protein